MEMKFLREILKKTKDWLRNTNTRLKLGVDEPKNNIQKSKLTQFEHVMQMREERIPMKILHTKWSENIQGEDTEPNVQTKLEMVQNEDVKIVKKYKKVRSGRIETAVIVEPQLWERLKNDNDGDDDYEKPQNELPNQRSLWNMQYSPFCR